MKKISFFLSIILLLCLSCNEEAIERVKTSDNSQYAFVTEGVSKSMSVTDIEMVGKLNEFGFNFAKLIPSGSYSFSPLSACLLLGMLSDGAEGQTRDELLSVLGLGGIEQNVINAFARKMLLITRTSSYSMFEIANGIIMNKDCLLKDAYFRRSKEFYDAYVSNLDFSSMESLAIINGWASEKTHGLINPLLDSIEPSMFAYFLSSVYFKSNWNSSFDISETTKESFSKTDGTTQTVDMMKKVGPFSIAQKGDLKMLRVDYKGGEFNFNVILSSQHSDVLSLLDELSFRELSQGLQRTNVDLWIPKFNMLTKIDLSSPLEVLGVKKLSRSPDFSSMTASDIPGLLLYQKSALKIDEEGTQAASVSYNDMDVDTPPNIPEPDTIVFHADKSFVFIITHKATGSIVFIGSYDGD